MGFRKNNQEYGDFLSQGSTFVSILFWVPPLMETPHLGYETNHFLEIFHGLMHDSVLVCIYIYNIHNNYNLHIQQHEMHVSEAVDPKGSIKSS